MLVVKYYVGAMLSMCNHNTMYMQWQCEWHVIEMLVPHMLDCRHNDDDRRIERNARDASRPPGRASRTGPDSIPIGETLMAVKGNSPYANAMNAAGVTGLSSAATPNELIDMLDALAKLRGYSHRNGLLLAECAKLVNAAGMTHLVDGKMVPWKYTANRTEAEKALDKANAELADLKAKLAKLEAKPRKAPTAPDVKANAATGELEPQA